MIALTDRTLLRLSGADTKSFLQGITTNNVETMREGEAIFTCLLTPQGKWLHEFFLYDCGNDGLLLDVHHTHADALMATLKKYKLRSKVQWEIVDDLAVYASLQGVGTDEAISGLPRSGDASTRNDGVIFAAIDPRHAEMGKRIIRHALPASRTPFPNDYHAHRISLGIPDGEYDTTDRSLPIELGYDLLNGIDFAKGCYVGQEVTARMHYRKVRRRVPAIATWEGDMTAHSPLFLNNKEVGWLGTATGNMAVAIIKTDALTNSEATLTTADGVAVQCAAPEWVTQAFEEAVENTDSASA